MKYLLGIDIGTSAAKTALVSESGEVIALAAREYPIESPKPGWAEQNPDDWWEAVKTGIYEVLKKSSLPSRKIAGISLSGQMHGTVLFGKDPKPIRPAIIWADQRTKDQCDWIYAKASKERLARIAANPVAPGFMAPTLLWIRENEPQNFEAIEKVLLPTDYVRFRLCGEICTDASNASGSLLFDTYQRQWSGELLDFLGLPTGIFPPVVESTAPVGCVTRQAAAETGLAENTPVVAGGADQGIAAVGNGVVAPGDLLSTIGTGGQLLTPLNKVIVDPQLRTHTFCHALPDRWFLMGAILSAGLCLRWFRDNFGDNYQDLDKEAATVPAGSEGLLFLPYLLGERTPHMDPEAKGVFFGLSLRHRRAHFIRAVMEGVALAMRDSLEIMKELGIEVSRGIVSGGGAKSNLWRQIQADVYNIELTTTRIPEQAAFGAALIAGVGVGVYENVESACQKTITYSHPTYPIKENVKRYQNAYQIFKALYPKLKDDFHSISRVYPR